MSFAVNYTSQLGCILNERTFTPCGRPWYILRVQLHAARFQPYNYACSCMWYTCTSVRCHKCLYTSLTELTSLAVYWMEVVWPHSQITERPGNEDGYHSEVINQLGVCWMEVVWPHSQTTERSGNEDGYHSEATLEQLIGQTWESYASLQQKVPLLWLGVIITLLFPLEFTAFDLSLWAYLWVLGA